MKVKSHQVLGVPPEPYANACASTSINIGGTFARDVLIVILTGRLLPK